MRYWIVTDLHFGHEAMINFCGRPVGYENRTINAIKNNVAKSDVLINLGDFAFNDYDTWIEKYMSVAPAHNYLIRGNHDKRSDAYYLSNGFSMVATRLDLDRCGLKIALTHKPLRDSTDFDLNIFGHFHNNPLKYCEPHLVGRITNKHKLLVLENNNYTPWSLAKLAVIHTRERKSMGE